VTKKIFFLLCLFFLLSCNNIEFVLKQTTPPNHLADNTFTIFNGIKNEEFSQELILLLGNKSDAEFILTTFFVEKKENRLVKQNQAAEKIDYELIVDYKIFYKNSDCTIFNKKIVTRFSFVPKSFGYNFGTDISLENLYKSSIKKNIQRFISLVPKNKTPVCLL